MKASLSLWRLLSSMNAAIAVLILIAVASVAGTIWNDSTLYSSWWYILLLSVAGLNLTACSINRFKTLWRQTFAPNLAVSEEDLRAMQRWERYSHEGSIDKTSAEIIAFLRSRSYRSVARQTEESVCIHADRGRIAIWGSYLTHISILTIFIGAFVGNRLGFCGYAVIPEGGSVTTCQVKGSGSEVTKEQNLGFRLSLRRFTLMHDDHGNPTAYRSDLQAFDGHRLVARKVIDVNHPLVCNGISFLQNSFGVSSLTLKLTSQAGDCARLDLRTDIQNGEYSISGSPFKQVRLGGKTLTFYVHDLAPDYVSESRMSAETMGASPAVNLMVSDSYPNDEGLGSWRQLGWLELSKSVDYHGCTITLEHAVEYTGLLVTRNPGLPVVYFGFALLVIALFTSFYQTHRVIRVLVSSSVGGSTITAGARCRGRESVFDDDFERLARLFHAKGCSDSLRGTRR